MFEVNKALAHARAHVTVRLTKIRYTEKGNLTGVISENASAEGLLNYAPVVMVELMTGEQLPYAPRWIKGDTLAERFDSGSIKRSTMVLTVKRKKAADVMVAKALTFGGKRHEVERFWERGEGAMCMRCCGPDHFGQCTEEPKCFVCVLGPCPK